MNAGQRDDFDGWVEASDYDLETAEAMLRTGRFLYVLFCCQQAVEKRLKASFVRSTGRMPPKVHDLLRLVEQAGLPHHPDHLRLLATLNSYYIETRYPEEVREMSRQLTQGTAAACLRQVKEYLDWLDAQRK
jgi:HEPN domain-containing protein